MVVLRTLQHWFGRIAGFLTGGKRNEFTCGDCLMNERCGLPPSEECVARAAQIESGRARPRPLQNLDASY